MAKFKKISSIFIGATVFSSIALLSTYGLADTFDKQAKIEQNNQSSTRFINNRDWNINNINYIKNNLNYKDQIRVADFSNIFKTSKTNNKKVIDNIYTASNIGNLFFNDSYTRMRNVTLVNSLNAVEQIYNSYKLRYPSSAEEISAWSFINVMPTNYYSYFPNPSNPDGQYKKINNIPQFLMNKVLNNDFTSFKSPIINVPDQSTTSPKTWEAEQIIKFILDKQNLFVASPANGILSAKDFIIKNISYNDPSGEINFELELNRYLDINGDEVINQNPISRKFTLKGFKQNNNNTGVSNQILLTKFSNLSAEEVKNNFTKYRIELIKTIIANQSQFISNTANDIALIDDDITLAEPTIIDNKYGNLTTTLTIRNNKVKVNGNPIAQKEFNITIWGFKEFRNTTLDLYVNDMYQLSKIKIPDIISDIGEIAIGPNSFYSLRLGEYEQRTSNDSNQSVVRKQELVVDWATKDEKIYPKFNTDISTIHFWIDLLMKDQFKNVSRMLVKPANLIIYRSNDRVKLVDITLNSNTSTDLVVPEPNNPSYSKISFDSWANTCINSNPDDDFDFRNLGTGNVQISGIKSINIPKIIKIDDNEYRKTKSYFEPTKIVPSLLYAQKPNGSNNRNWGTNAYKSLENIFISMGAYAENLNSTKFSIKHVNDIRLSTDFTNASTNTGSNDQQDNIQDQNAGIFSNQFFVAPNLKSVYLNSIESFFSNFNFLNELPIYYNQNKETMSKSSYKRYEEISINFAPERWRNILDASQQKSAFNDFRLKDSIYASDGANNELGHSFHDNIDVYLNSFLNYLAKNRDKNNLTYECFQNNQNQWYAFNPNLYSLFNGKESFRFDYIFGLSDLYQTIALPFSLFPVIMDRSNNLYLQNNINISANGRHISRCIDPTTLTIIYSNLFIDKNKVESTYPPFELDNESFSLFIDEKVKNANIPEGQPKVIEITFNDWVKNGWTSISETLDIVKILNEKDVTVNEMVIPKIIMMNNNTIKNLRDLKVNNSLVTTILLVIGNVVLGLIILFVIFKIIKSPNKYKWPLTTAQDECGY